MTRKPKEGTEPLYWRSLEALDEEPRALSFQQREFPEDATVPPEGISRRGVFSILGASVSLATLAGCRRPVREIVPYVNAPETMLPGIPRAYATTMPFGLDALGVVVESDEGRPTKIEGNELHPSSNGASSALMQASVLDLYDPDRAQTVTSAASPAQPVAAGDAPAAEHAPDTSHGGSQGREASSWAAFVAAWAERDSVHQASGGADLAILAQGSTSPTRARLFSLLRQRFPSVTIVTHEAVSDENLHRGHESATGSALVPSYDFEKARVIVAIDSDFLLTESNAVANLGRFARGRSVHGPSDEMSRLYAIEASHSLTGANAEHRLVLRPSAVPAFVATLAHELGSLGVDLGTDSAESHGDFDQSFVSALAHDLVEHKGLGLLVAGRHQAPEVHAAVYAMNQALGNNDATVSYRPLAEGGRSDRASLARLAS